MKTQLPSINVKLIISINRRESIDSAEANVELAIKLNSQYPTIICGVDLSGDPVSKVFADFEPLLAKARDNGLKLALHCGEVENREEEIHAMLQFGMNRLGHGTFIKGISIRFAKYSFDCNHSTFFLFFCYFNIQVKMRKFC